ncbi:MAG: hypothetical protein U9R54_06640 [Bacteroidota bacterium]|nr:hypothetical protein [Bacteroidota bacterium]
MNTSIETSSKHSANSINIGVVIIFAIITILFLIALWQSNYTKEIFSVRTEQLQ